MILISAKVSFPPLCQCNGTIPIGQKELPLHNNLVKTIKIEDAKKIKKKKTYRSIACFLVKTNAVRKGAHLPVGIFMRTYYLL